MALHSSAQTSSYWYVLSHGWTEEGVVLCGQASEDVELNHLGVEVN